MISINSTIYSLFCLSVAAFDWETPAQFTVTSPLMLSCTRSSPLYAPHSHSHRAHAHKHTRTHTRSRTCTRTPTCLPRLICELFTPHIAPRPHTKCLSNATNGLMIDDQLTLVFGNWVNLYKYIDNSNKNEKILKIIPMHAIVFCGFGTPARPSPSHKSIRSILMFFPQ